MNPAPIKPNVTAGVPEQLDIRVGTILAVDDVPNSGKLVQLTSASAIASASFSPP
jgi:tRNA-binding EMAP/Myf-like protein